MVTVKSGSTMPASPLFIASLPERLLRSVSALAAGLLRELGEVTLPARIRRTHLYHALVETTLRFLIVQVGEVQGAYPSQVQISEDFLFRRTAGNGIELMGIAAFHASPVWILAALADASGIGRELLPEITEVLQEEGLLAAGEEFETVDQMLDGLERTAGSLAESINMPPLNVTALRKQWAQLQSAFATLAPAQMPSPAFLVESWRDLQREAEVQKRSVFAMSSLMAVSALAHVPEAVLAISRAVPRAVLRTGQLVAGSLLTHYGTTLQEIHTVGYLEYGQRELQPYLRAAAEQFSPAHSSLTEKLLRRVGKGRGDSANTGSPHNG